MPEVGSNLGPWKVGADDDDIRAFAVVLDDPNPIHLDPNAVRSMGLGERVINQGPAGIGYLMNMLRSSFGGAVIEELEVNLTSLVRGGDVLIAGGTVDDVKVADGRRRYRCTVWLDVVGGSRAIVGTATMVVADSTP